MITLKISPRKNHNHAFLFGVICPQSEERARLQTGTAPRHRNRGIEQSSECLQPRFQVPQADSRSPRLSGHSPSSATAGLGTQDEKRAQYNRERTSSLVIAGSFVDQLPLDPNAACSVACSHLQEDPAPPVHARVKNEPGHAKDDKVLKYGEPYRAPAVPLSQAKSTPPVETPGTTLRTHFSQNVCGDGVPVSNEASEWKGPSFPSHHFNAPEEEEKHQCGPAC